MGKATKLTPDELQRDEVAETLQEGVTWVRQHRNNLIIAGIALVVVLMIWLAVRGSQASTRAETNALMGQALSTLERMDNVTDPTARKDFEASVLQNLNTLIEAYGDTPLGNEARYLKGMMLYQGDKYPEARAEYENYIRNAGDNERKARGTIALAYAFENESFLTTDTTKQKSLLDEALKNYQEAQKLSPAPGFQYYYARLGEARYHEVNRDERKALELYEEIAKARSDKGETETADATKGDEASGTQIEQLRKYLQENERSLTLGRTAEIRLERLRAKLGEAATTATTTVISNQ